MLSHHVLLVQVYCTVFRTKPFYSCYSHCCDLAWITSSHCTTVIFQMDARIIWVYPKWLRTIKAWRFPFSLPLAYSVWHHVKNVCYIRPSCSVTTPRQHSLHYPQSSAPTRLSAPLNSSYAHLTRSSLRPWNRIRNELVFYQSNGVVWPIWIYSASGSAGSAKLVLRWPPWFPWRVGFYSNIPHRFELPVLLFLWNE